MPKSQRNAAICYTSDGYDPVSNGINGRRMAGQSFLKGFFLHADVDEFVSMTKSRKSGQEFKRLAQALGTGQHIRSVYSDKPHELAPCSTLFYSALNIENELWRRQSSGNSLYSICGINHTISTNKSMEAVFAVRAGPQCSWDGIICTSRSSLSGLERQMDAIDEMFEDRFGSVPPRPQMPVIPLGSNTDEYARDDIARKTLRKKLGYTEDDIVVATVSRLEPYGKFDPFPLYLALEQAQAELSESGRLRFMACGYYKDKHSELVFEEGARKLMPSVSYNLYDGSRPEGPGEAMSAADIFIFPIDNFQETFGLAPIEAMAAGLPVIVSDWDGMKDTVTSDVGIRVETRMLGGPHSLPEAWQYLNNPDQSGEYGANTSAMVEIDIKAMKDAIVALAKNKDLRTKMGAAGTRRARTVYDWSVIVPQYQDFWSELNEIRVRDGGKPPGSMQMNPIALPPTWQFRDYATNTLEAGIGPCVAKLPNMSVEAMFELRRYNKTKSAPFEIAANITIVYGKIVASGPAGTTSNDVATQLKTHRYQIDRMFIWLMKYDYIAVRDVPQAS